ncbi:hypothetical protein FO519_005108 [Halicephalobus sp. NKZ332]|nr:hypothetical protein FO519_005108 [Halicephalobus sp. NKZ332]
MASRMRTNAPNVYDAFYVFERQSNDSGTPSIQLVKKYPQDLDDGASIEAIKKFCFPKTDTKLDPSDPVAFFTFTLTDGQGFFTFGHCRFSPSKKTCMCIISALPDIAFFKYTLGYLSIAGPHQVEHCLQYMYYTPVPEDQQLIKYPDLAFSHILRDFKKCCCSFNDTEVIMLFNSLQYSTAQLIYLYASILKERRILITASKLETLTSCTFGALKLLYPFYWQNIFISILPADLLDQLQAPMPYLIGVPKETLKGIDLSQYGDIVVLDIDDQVFTSDNEDLLPVPIYKYLAKQLKVKDSISLMTPDALIRAFMKATVIIFGRYRTGLCKADSEQNSKITWDRQRFIAAQPQELKTFVQALVCEEGVQYFERFVDEKVEALNNGMGSNEEFDKMLRNIDEYWQEAIDVSRNFKDTVQGAMLGVKNNTNAVFGTIKGTFQQAMKKKPSFTTPKVGRKKKELPIPPYSFAPPVITSPERPEPPTEFPPHSSSPDIDLMFFDNRDDGSSGSAQSRTNSSIFKDGSNDDVVSSRSSFNSATNTIHSIQFSATNPFVVPSTEPSVTVARDHWEKFD